VPDFTTPVGTTYKAQGCFLDNSGTGYPLTNAGAQESVTTVEQCLDFCSQGSYLLAGIEGSLCFCSNTEDTAAVAMAGNCNTLCAGDPSQLCGGMKKRSTKWRRQSQGAYIVIYEVSIFKMNF
jgi:hypothetical protein